MSSDEPDALEEYIRAGIFYDIICGLDKIKWLTEKWKGDLNENWSPSMLWAHEHTKLEFTKEARRQAGLGNPEMAVKLFCEMLFKVTMYAPTVSETEVFTFLHEICTLKVLSKTREAIEKTLKTKSLYAALLKSSILEGLPNYVLRLIPEVSLKIASTEDAYDKPGTLAVLVYFSRTKISEVPLKLIMQEDPFSLVVFLRELKKKPSVGRAAFIASDEDTSEVYFKRIWVLLRHCAYDSAMLKGLRVTRFVPELMLLRLFCEKEFNFKGITIRKKNNMAATGVRMSLGYPNVPEEEPEDSDILARPGDVVNEDMVSRALDHDEWTIVYLYTEKTAEHDVSADTLVALLLMQMKPTQGLLLKTLEVKRVESAWYMVHADLDKQDNLDVIDLLETAAPEKLQVDGGTEIDPIRESTLWVVLTHMTILGYFCGHHSFSKERFYEKLLRPAITRGVPGLVQQLCLIERYELKLYSYADGIMWWYLDGKPRIMGNRA